MQCEMGLLQHNGHMKTIARLVAGVLATLMALVLATAVSAACSCAPRTTAEHVAEADVVARVVVERVSIPDLEANDRQLATYTFRPTYVWKGDVVSLFKVDSEPTGGACGLEGIQEGSELVVFATQSADGLAANLCGGTAPASERLVGDLLDVIGTGVAIDAEPGEEPGTWVWPAITGLAAVLIVGGAVVYWWVLPRRRL